MSVVGSGFPRQKGRPDNAREKRILDVVKQQRLLLLLRFVLKEHIPTPGQERDHAMDKGLHCERGCAHDGRNHNDLPSRSAERCGQMLAMGVCWRETIEGKQSVRPGQPDRQSAGDSVMALRVLTTCAAKDRAAKRRVRQGGYKTLKAKGGRRRCCAIIGVRWREKKPPAD